MVNKFKRRRGTNYYIEPFRHSPRSFYGESDDSEIPASSADDGTTCSPMISRRRSGERLLSSLLPINAAVEGRLTRTRFGRSSPDAPSLANLQKELENEKNLRAELEERLHTLQTKLRHEKAESRKKERLHKIEMSQLKQSLLTRERDVDKRETRIGIEYGKIEQLRRSVKGDSRVLEEELRTMAWQKETAERVFEETRRRLAHRESEQSETEQRWNSLANGVSTLYSNLEATTSRDGEWQTHLKELVMELQKSRKKALSSQVKHRVTSSKASRIPKAKTRLSLTHGVSRRIRKMKPQHLDLDLTKLKLS